MDNESDNDDDGERIKHDCEVIIGYCHEFIIAVRMMRLHELRSLLLCEKGGLKEIYSLSAR